MLSRRRLGFIALFAMITSAVSFAVVDVSISNANGCFGSAAVCSDKTIPAAAIAFALLGVFSLIASIVPALAWFTEAVRYARFDEHDDQVEPFRSYAAPGALAHSLAEDDA